MDDITTTQIKTEIVFLNFRFLSIFITCPLENMRSL